jgi:phosphoglycolate phosphatase-like HAD superfamily hydrolase
MGLYSRDDLAGLQPRHDALIGIDSDGCVFDSMAVKQCWHFHPLIIRHWGLERIGAALRETAEFVNLGSVWRGRNRFVSLLKTFELLAARADVRSAGVALPALDPIRAYVESGVALGNPTLEEAAARTGNAELARLLAWSLDVNRSIAAQPEPIPPFAGAREALARMAAVADTIVVSQTPEAALVSEWRQHGMEGFVRLIAGQELGTKAEHITLAAKGKYAPGRVLLLGDAPGDLEAAREAGVSFFPIVPGHEVECWKRFRDEALGRFLAGNYDADYADGLMEPFLKALPAQPPWS